MADETLGDIIADVSDEDGIRRVEVEITHRHEDDAGSRSWTIALVMTLIIAGALIYAADTVKDFGGDDGDGEGDCNDGKDNDDDHLEDHNDPGCMNGGKWEGTR